METSDSKISEERISVFLFLNLSPVTFSLLDTILGHNIFTIAAHPTGGVGIIFSFFIFFWLLSKFRMGVSKKRSVSQPAKRECASEMTIPPMPPTASFLTRSARCEDNRERAKRVVYYTLV